MTPAQPQPRVWQFSIKSILLLTLLVAAFFAGKVSSDKKLGRIIQAEEEARKREAERAQAMEDQLKAEADKAAVAEKQAKIQAMLAMRAQQMAQDSGRRAEADYQTVREQLKQAQQRRADAENNAALDRKELEALRKTGEQLTDAAQRASPVLELLKAIEACLPPDQDPSGETATALKLTSISFAHHDDLASWFKELPEPSKSEHMLKEDASRPPAGAGHVVTLVVSCPQPPNEPTKVPAALNSLLTNLRERTGRSAAFTPEDWLKRRTFTHVTLVPSAAESKDAGTYTVEFIWKGHHPKER